MTQEDKETLIKDLCARLYTCNCMYGTALTVALADEQPLEANQWLISNYDCYNNKFTVFNIVYASDVERIVDIDNIRPFLFPFSSMTEEQKEDMIKSSCGIGSDKNVFDWYNKNHFDYRNLIEKGIAIDATGLNIY